MNYNDLIHQFLDGELDSVNEDVLFSNLSNNTEIREMFKQQVQLHLLTQNDMASITTPSESTNYIFSSLGLSVPPIQKPAPKHPIPVPLFEKHILSHNNKYLTTALTAIISIALTSLFFLLNQKEFTDSNMNYTSIDKGSQNSLNYPVSSNIKNTNSYVNGSKDLANSNNNTNNTKPVIKYIYVNSNNQNGETNSQILANNYKLDNNPKNIKNTNDELFALSSSELPTKNLKPLNTSNTNNSTLNTNPLNIFAIDLSSLSKFELNESNLTLQWRNITASSSDATENLPSAQEPLFINQGIALIYKLDDNNSIGIEVGQEHFLQQFTRKIGEQEYTYTQNPVLFWYGGFYKLSLPSLGYKNMIVPYTQVFAGGTTAGFIGRGQLGIQYNYDNFLKFYVAGEFSSLLYNVQNKINRTDKFGITYGLSLSY